MRINMLIACFALRGKGHASTILYAYIMATLAYSNIHMYSSTGQLSLLEDNSSISHSFICVSWSNKGNWGTFRQVAYRKFIWINIIFNGFIANACNRVLLDSK